MASGAIDSPILKIPKTEIAIKKDFTRNNKEFKFSARMAEPVSKYVSMSRTYVHNLIKPQVENCFINVLFLIFYFEHK